MKNVIKLFGKKDGRLELIEKVETVDNLCLSEGWAKKRILFGYLVGYEGCWISVQFGCFERLHFGGYGEDWRTVVFNWSMDGNGEKKMCIPIIEGMNIDFSIPVFNRHHTEHLEGYGETMERFYFETGEIIAEQDEEGEWNNYFMVKDQADESMKMRVDDLIVPQRDLI